MDWPSIWGVDTLAAEGSAKHSAAARIRCWIRVGFRSNIRSSCDARKSWILMRIRGHTKTPAQQVIGRLICILWSAGQRKQHSV